MPEVSPAVTGSGRPGKVDRKLVLFGVQSSWLCNTGWGCIGEQGDPRLWRLRPRGEVRLGSEAVLRVSVLGPDLELVSSCESSSDARSPGLRS